MRGGLGADETGQPVRALRNIRLTVAFDGTAYSGWQIQKGQPTVQGELAAAVRRITGENVVPAASGRTDAGAHARAIGVGLQVRSGIAPASLLRALNSVLPRDIRVTGAWEAAPDFHPRRSAHSKTYRYNIYRGPVLPPHLVREYFHYPYQLDLSRVDAAVGRFVGEHDFGSFAARSGADKQDGPRGTVRRIFRADVQRSGHRLWFTFTGDGFLHHMVRNMVGTALEVGRGAMSADEFEALFSHRDRTKAGFTAPAHGLVLLRVHYRRR
jgi:tRNA pseudouridine38-40 synthase